MKSKELIRLLQEEDPSGEIEVCVSGEDIHFVGREPGYYDGCFEVLERDSKKTGHCYDVIGAQIRSEGQKLKIHTISVQDAIWTDPNLPVSFDSDYSRRHYHKRVAQWRADVNDYLANHPRKAV